MPQTSDRPFITDDDRWNAIVTRCAEAETAFFYGVKTTGIYCRPTCASRLPNRQNVLFFETGHAAEAVGFRACRRCQPQGKLPRQQQAEAIAQICQQIESSGTSLSLEALAEQVGLSPFHFQRQFKAIVGLTPKQYEMAHRAKRVRQALTQHESVTEAVYEAGFESSSSFYREATEQLGMQPMSYQKGGKGERIRYAVQASDLGWVIVAATDRGVCAIQFCDAPEAAIAHLKAQFSKAQLEPGDAEMKDWVEGAIALIETPHVASHLPLDIQGTVFQQKVWEVLRSIPPGKTASYTEVAQQLGNPKAVRAVARACASNQIAVAIPCHRVIGSDGSLTGYRWGVDRKRALLKREAE